MSYPVGTICIGQKLLVDTEFNGLQCVVINPIAWISSWKDFAGNPRHPAYAYRVQWSDGRRHFVEHHNLKRKDLFTKEELSAINTRLYPKDREKVSAVISAALKAAESGEKV